MKLIVKIYQVSIILGIIILAACSDKADLNYKSNQTTSDNEYVSQTPVKFEVDPFWPAPLPNSWLLGEISGVAVDAQDHLWIVQRPNSLTERETAAAQDPKISDCCNPAPSVIEFDPDGKVVQAWGNPETHESWISTEHGIFIDDEGYVWIAGNGGRDQVVLKLSNSGEILLKIGEWGVTKGSNDTKHLGGPTDMAVDTEANEVYISDGYGNRRIIVFDSETGEYKRHWGAYGEVPDDSELPDYHPEDKPLKSFRNPVHGVRISNDDLVYVADRTNNRIQVFKKDGTFVSEAFVARKTLMAGSVWDIELSPDPEQTYLYIADGMNRKVWVLKRKTLEITGSFGQGGRMAGQFGWAHNVAMDSKGNLFVTEVSPGQRIQKFKPVPN